MAGFAGTCPSKIREIGEIRWPGEERSGYEGWQRGDDLWQHTCFEAFGAIEGIPGYYELNFATSGKWAAYRFSDYRKGMQPTDELGLVVARWFIHERQMGFEAVMQVPKEFGDLTWDVGLSAVIEEKSGNKSYWALAHLPGKPDFHHPACFAARLEPPGV